jgi:hypothetical protein
MVVKISFTKAYACCLSSFIDVATLAIFILLTLLIGENNCVVNSSFLEKNEKKINFLMLFACKKVVILIEKNKRGVVKGLYLCTLFTTCVTVLSAVYFLQEYDLYDVYYDVMNVFELLVCAVNYILYAHK